MRADRQSSLTVLLASVALAIAATLAITATPSWADDDEEDEDDDDLAEARKLYALGNAHYAAGRYEKAARAFQKGYELSELPGFLYNLANAFERMGEYAKAADRLELYLESPKAKDVVSVKERVRRLRAAAEAREKELSKQRARDEAAARKALFDARDRGEQVDYDQGPRTNTYLYFLGGAGVAVAGAGIFALISRSAASSAASSCGPGGVCDRPAEAQFLREKRYALLTDLSLGLGVALAGVGGYLYLKGGPRIRRSRERLDADESADPDDSSDPDGAEVHIGPLLTPFGIGLGALGRF